jgi:predicted ATP-grasp superfamily ATP-dependent carboligase
MAREPSPELDTSRPVLVVRVGRSPLLNHGAVGAIRSLGRLGVPVYALTEDRAAPVGTSRYLTGRFVWPVTGGEDPRVLAAALRRICARIGRPAIALPTSDEAAVLLADQQHQLSDVLIQPPVDAGLPGRLVDKYAMFELCSGLGIPTPRSLLATSGRELGDAVARLGFPVVVKNADLAGRRVSPAVGTTTKLGDAAEVAALAAALERTGFKRLLVQEFVPEDGPPARRASDWFAHVYCPSDGRAPLVFTGRKLHNWPPGGGVTSRGVAVSNPRLAALTAQVCRAVGYRGIGDMDWRYDPRDDAYKLVDFNPRLGAQAQMFRTTTGLDLVRALHADLSGREIEPGRQVDGRELIVEPLDAAATIVAWRGRVAQARGSGAGRAQPRVTVTRREPAWFAWDDPLPFFVVTVRFGRNAAIKSARLARDAAIRVARGVFELR